MYTFKDYDSITIILLTLLHHYQYCSGVVFISAVIMVDASIEILTIFLKNSEELGSLKDTICRVLHKLH